MAGRMMEWNRCLSPSGRTVLSRWRPIGKEVGLATPRPCRNARHGQSRRPTPPRPATPQPPHYPVPAPPGLGWPMRGATGGSIEQDLLSICFGRFFCLSSLFPSPVFSPSLSSFSLCFRFSLFFELSGPPAKVAHFRLVLCSCYYCRTRYQRQTLVRFVPHPPPSSVPMLAYTMDLVLLALAHCMSGLV